MTRKTKSAPRAQARTGLDRARATVYTIDVEVDDTPVRVRQVKENARGVMDTTVKVPKLENMARQQTIEDAAEISDIACSMFNDCRLSKVMKERLSAIQSRSARILRNNGGK